MEPFMKALFFRAHGDLDQLEYGELPQPEPGPGEALIAIRAAALNRLDLFVRRGLPNLKLALPHVGGSDMAGVVQDVGAGVDVGLVGRRVLVNPMLLNDPSDPNSDGRIIGEHTPGGFAEYAVAPAANLLPLPESMPFAEAAAAPLVFQTAWRALITRAGLRAGETVLILGASGGVATAAIQIAKLAGAYVYAVTSSEEKERRARELGADETINYRQVNFSKEVWQRTGKRGVDVVLENVGAQTWEDSLRALARGGRLVTFGATSGPIGATNINLLFWKQISLLGSTMASYHEFRTVMGLVLAGRLRPVVGRVLPLSEGREAQRILEAGEQFGKIVLLPA
jgi:NADPH:quinone reductase-like Zn-dependent oxidoreductase